MKKFLTVCALAGALSLNANAQSLGGLLKSLTGGSNTTETTTTTTTETTETTEDAANSLLGGLLGALSGSGTTSANEEGTALTNDGVVSGLLGSILNAFVTVDQNTLLGTWNFKGSAFVFESENALANLSSDAVAEQVEARVDKYLAKLNIKEDACDITFNEDGTCVFVAGKRSLNGTYEFNKDTKELALTFGLVSTTAYLVYDAGTINIVYQSDGLLRILKAIGSMSSNGTLALLNTLLEQYDGLRIGMAFEK
ncbi:MAG: DUF4923 family protein [Bacteroidaceae bacterium]|nr:DUF4923 family protein [Bacteroidaceae bacterium]